MRADIPDHASSAPWRTASVINFFVGIWVLISPFVLKFTRFHGAVWNNLIVGIIIIVIAGMLAWAGTQMTSISWINFVLGIWLIVSAWVWGFRMNPVLSWNQVISGIVVAIIAALSTVGRRSVQPPVVS